MTMRVLVVDDDTYIRRLVTAIIGDHDDGWSVVGEAADGEQGVELARELQPDLVLLDLSMPVMDGLEALPQIRQDVPDAMIVVLTGFPGSVAQAAAELAGAQGFLEKDSLVSLVPKLEAVIEQIRNKAAEHRPVSSTSG